MAQIKQTLPKGWHWAKLGEVTRVVAGTTPKSGVGEYWNDGEIVWITPTDLGGNSEKDIVTSTRLITKIGFESCGLEIVPPGSIVLSSRAPIGYLGIARIPLCTNQGCKTFVPSDQVDSLFLYYALKQSVSTLQRLGSGATFSEVSKTQLENFEIPLPPLNEQKRIAARLDEQMSHIEQARQAAEESLSAAWELPSAYLKEMFEGQAAKKYPHKQLVELCEVRLGKMLSPVSKTGTRSRPYLRNLNVQWGRFDLSDVAEMDFKEQEDERYVLRSGDLLVCEGGEPGRAAVWNGEIQPCYYQKALHRLRPIDSSVDTYYVMYRLWSGAIKKEFIDSNAHTTIAHLPKIRLEKLSIPVPPFTEQKRIVGLLKEYMENSNRVIAKIESQLTEINELPSALLRQAFAGELST